MLIHLGLLTLGFVVLVWGADRFVGGAAALARNLGVSPLVVGLTIVGFGTSAPEMLVSGVAAWEGNAGLSVGNALGSNITNIALVLGLTALVAPLRVASQTLRRELPLLILVMLLVAALLWDGHLGRLDGVLLVGGFFVLMGWIVWLGLRSRGNDPLVAEFTEELPRGMRTGVALLWLVVGLLALLLGSRLAVQGAVAIAQALGVSDLVIGLTVVALGTSLPELAAALASALKNEHDIALGNVVGSNLFNLLAVLGLPGLIAPLAVAPEVMGRDYPLMLGLTLALVLMGRGLTRPGHINRPEGAILLAVYFGYLWLLYRQSLV